MERIIREIWSKMMSKLPHLEQLVDALVDRHEPRRLVNFLACESSVADINPSERRMNHPIIRIRIKKQNKIKIKKSKSQPNTGQHLFLRATTEALRRGAGDLSVSSPRAIFSTDCSFT